MKLFNLCMSSVVILSSKTSFDLLKYKNFRFVDALIEKEFSDKTILNTKSLKGFGENDYEIIEFENSGYIIYESDTFFPVEHSKKAPSPFIKYNKDLIYGGPTRYYVSSSDENGSLKHTIEDETFDFSDSLLTSLSVLQNKSHTSNTQFLNAVNNSIIPPIINSNYITNHQFITGIEDFYFSGGVCTYISAGIILYYNYKQFNTNFISEERLTPHGFNQYLMMYLTNIGRLLDIDLDTNAFEIKSVMEVYTADCVPEATHYAMLLSTPLNISLCIDNDKPVMLSGSFEDVSGGDENVDHTITAFGYTDTTVGFLTSRILHVNYGWEGYTDVSIVDNIFSNPIGCMYNLNPEG